jgi:hypothetical protein
MIDALIEANNEGGARPSVRSWQRAAARHLARRTCVRLFGSWPAAIAAAEEEVVRRRGGGGLSPVGTARRLAEFRRPIRGRGVKGCKPQPAKDLVELGGAPARGSPRCSQPARRHIRDGPRAAAGSSAGRSRPRRSRPR